MNSVWLRVFIAGILSLGVYGASQYLASSYRPVAAKNEAQKPIAFIQELQEDAEKRAANSLVWKSLTAGEDLRPGEAVKTSENSELRIQFVGSNRYIDLDPETLIVLNLEKGNEIALDLIDGSLFLGQEESKATSETAPALTLKSKDGNIDLTNATAQLSKSENENVSVQVIKGSIKEPLTQKPISRIEILSPRLDQPTYINPDANSQGPIAFQWKGAPKGSKVSLWLGKSRKNLKALESTDSEILNLNLRAGNYSWKLVAVDPTTQKILAESPLSRLRVVSRYPPTLISPAPDSETENTTVDFKWLPVEGSQKTILEVAKDALLKNKVVHKAFEDKSNFQEILPEGDYWLRISSGFQKGEALVSSEVFKFTVGRKAPPPPPEPVKTPVIISWLVDPNQRAQHFISVPKAKMAWQTNQPEQVHNWRLKIATDETALQNKDPSILVQELKTTAYEALLPKPGRYVAQVEALDEKNQLLAVSTTQALEIQPLPLLRAPRFLPLNADFQADLEGRLNLKWTAVEGAREYWVSLTDSEGRQIRKSKHSGLTAELTELLPGLYKVSVVAVDGHGRESEKESPRSVQVWETSGLEAPKIKNIKVK